ncbi:hypothetical protein SDC9_127647 [bioreactor metagenome]|uniref:Uncharacterized protein n=1 Tax=bioreactor metagenome TaxID=1076179 RepID=A0A645CUJ3_9ZZZZ
MRAKQLANLALQAVVGRAAGVAVVCDHHRGNGLIAHRVDPAVGEHVQIDILISQQKCVVARRCHRFLPRFHGKQVQLLHHAHFVHLERELFSRKQFYFAHCNDFLHLVI